MFLYVYENASALLSEILSTFECRTPIPLHGKGGKAIETDHPNYGFEMDLNDNI